MKEDLGSSSSSLSVSTPNDKFLVVLSMCVTLEGTPLCLYLPRPPGEVASETLLSLLPNVQEWSLRV